jgi:hypothetical protein
MNDSVLAAVRAAATTEHAPGEASVSLSAHTSAVNAARAEGEAVGAKHGAAAERTRIAAILDHANAKGREIVARKLAFTTTMSVEEAGAFLADLPAAAEAKGSKLDQAIAREAQPKVGADMGAQPTAKVIDTAAIYASRAAAARPLN